MSVSLTPAAARHVEKSLVKRGSGLGLRLAVKTSGCSGYAYALEFVDDRRHWGQKFRFGLFEVSVRDMARIAQAMRADADTLGLGTMDAPCAAPTDSLPLFS